LHRDVSAEPARKIVQGFDWLSDFLSEWNNHVYFRVKKITQAIKD
jgi:hypothetical protein